MSNLYGGKAVIPQIQPLNLSFVATELPEIQAAAA
jgi:hypothetical protein